MKHEIYKIKILDNIEDLLVKKRIDVFKTKYKHGLHKAGNITTENIINFSI